MSQLLYPTSVNHLSKQLNANYTAADATITLNNTTSIQNKPGVALINRVDTNGTRQPVADWTYIEYTATSGATLTGCTPIDNDQDHATGQVVEFISDVTQQQRILDALANLVDITTGAVDTTKVVTATGTQTLTNKTLTAPVINSATGTWTSRVDPRTNTVTSHATPTINTDTTDIFTITAQAEAITSMTTNLSGTPVNGQKLTIRIKDDGTARAITWGASFASRGATLPTTTVLGKYQYNGFIWNSTASTWDCVASINEA